MICIIDEDELKSVVYPSSGELQKRREKAAEYAVAYARHNTPEYRGRLDLINRTTKNDMLIVSFRRAK